MSADRGPARAPGDVTPRAAAVVRRPERSLPRPAVASVRRHQQSLDRTPLARPPVHLADTLPVPGGCALRHRAAVGAPSWTVSRNTWLPAAATSTTRPSSGAGHSRQRRRRLDGFGGVLGPAVLRCHAANDYRADDQRDGTGAPTRAPASGRPAYVVSRSSGVRSHLLTRPAKPGLEIVHRSSPARPAVAQRGHRDWSGS